MTNTFNISEQTWLILDRISILFSLILMIITIIGFINRNNLKRWFNRNQFPSIGGQPNDTNWQGLVFTLSNSEVPLWVISQIQPKPQAIAMLSTNSSRQQAEIVRHKAEQEGIRVFEEILNEPDDPAEANRKTKTLLQALVSEGINDIAVDITGGKTPMSVGAFMAAEESGCDSIYVTTSYNQTTKKRDISTARIKAISQAHT